MKRLHSEDIKAGIRKKWGSMAEFERANGLPEGSARDVLRDRGVAKTASAIAEALGVSVTVIRPPKKRGRASKLRNNTSTIGDSHRLNAGGK